VTATVFKYQTKYSTSWGAHNSHSSTISAIH